NGKVPRRVCSQRPRNRMTSGLTDRDLQIRRRPRIRRMNHEERRIAAVRRQIEAQSEELASGLAAEFEQRAAAVLQERLRHRRRFFVWCSLAAGLGLAGTVLVA